MKIGHKTEISCLSSRKGVCSHLFFFAAQFHNYKKYRDKLHMRALIFVCYKNPRRRHRWPSHRCQAHINQEVSVYFYPLSSFTCALQLQIPSQLSFMIVKKRLYAVRMLAIATSRPKEGTLKRLMVNSSQSKGNGCRMKHYRPSLRLIQRGGKLL